MADENPDGLTIEDLAAVLGAARESTRRETQEALWVLRDAFPTEGLEQLLDALRG